jgi:hypothetical protein
MRFLSRIDLRVESDFQELCNRVFAYFLYADLLEIGEATLPAQVRVRTALELDHDVDVVFLQEMHNTVLDGPFVLQVERGTIDHQRWRVRTQVWRCRSMK